MARPLIFNMNNWNNKALELFGEEAQASAPLAEHTTYRVGGNAEMLIRPVAPEGLSSVVRFASGYGVPMQVLGAGSNVLVSDEGLGGIVCLTGGVDEIEPGGDFIRAEAGALLDAVVSAAVSGGLAGMEKLSGIPGSVGGAVRMNAGAFGQETFDLLESFTAIKPDGGVITLQKKDIRYAYRKVEGLEELVVLSALWRVPRGDVALLAKTRAEILASRAAKQPLEFPSAGSVFKRPAGDYASRLIDFCGLKGARVGGAKVSEKHAGFIVNSDGASAEDIAALICLVRDEVFERTGVRLELEQIPLGVFKNKI